MFLGKSNGEEVIKDPSPVGLVPIDDGSACSYLYSLVDFQLLQVCVVIFTSGDRHLVYLSQCWSKGIAHFLLLPLKQV
jgi:hypothetical protein